MAAELAELALVKQVDDVTTAQLCHCILTNFESSSLSFNLNFLKVELKTEDALGGPPLVPH